MFVHMCGHCIKSLVENSLSMTIYTETIGLLIFIQGSEKVLAY